MAVLAFTPAAVAAPLTIEVTKAEVELKKADAGWTTQVEVRNLTDRAVALTAEAPDCPLTIGGGTKLQLGPGDPQKLTIAAPASCKLKDRLDVTLHGDATDVALTATTGDPEPDPFWEALLALPISVVVSSIVTLIMVGLSTNRWTDKLKGIEASWSFEDSWVTNITAASALIVTGLGASDALTAILGDEGKATVGVATVATAIGAALAAAGGVVVVADKRRDSESITVFGLALAGAIASGAGAGQIWAITLLLVDGDYLTFWPEVLIVLAALLATFLLGWYTVSSFRRLLDKKEAPTEPDPLGLEMSDEVLAAVVTAAAAGETVTREEVQAIREALAPTEKTGGESDRAALPPPRRPRAFVARSSAMF